MSESTTFPLGKAVWVFIALLVSSPAATFTINHFFSASASCLFFLLFHLSFSYATTVIKQLHPPSSPPHSPLSTSWTRPSFTPRVSLAVSPFLPPTRHFCLHPIIWCPFPHRCAIFSSRRRPAGFLWYTGWRRRWWQFGLGGRERDGEAGLRRRWLCTSQNHGERSVKNLFLKIQRWHS